MLWWGQAQGLEAIEYGKPRASLHGAANHRQAIDSQGVFAGRTGSRSAGSDSARRGGTEARAAF